MVVGANVQDRSEESTYWHLVFFDVPFFLLSIFLCYPGNRKGLEFTTQTIKFHAGRDLKDYLVQRIWQKHSLDKMVQHHVQLRLKSVQIMHLIWFIPVCIYIMPRVVLVILEH